VIDTPESSIPLTSLANRGQQLPPQVDWLRVLRKSDSRSGQYQAEVAP
jgi:hypothetical protein